jgi:hypothetical protein
LSGKHEKRDPLTVWKVYKEKGSKEFYYSLRDGNTTFQMLKSKGWTTFPVEIEKEIVEKDLTPVKPHSRK